MKVAIIGAGICGLYLGWKLAEKGCDATIFEKKSKIGKVACSGLFSERILNFVPQSQRLIENKIEFCLIHYPGRTIRVNFSKKIFALSHFELDNLTANLAQKSGAKIILQHNVARTVLATLEERFDRIIGCDGADSIIRKSLGLPEPDYRLGIQGFIQKNDSSNPEAEPSARYGAGFVETWPTKSGFIWKIPRGKNIEYGIMEEPKEAKPIFEKFLKKNNLVLGWLNSALIPHSGLMVPKNSNITLCGDAALLTKPWSGGGVIWGLTAADILLKNFPDFLKYQKEMNKKFLPKIIFSKIAKKLVYFSGFKIPWIFPAEIKIESDFLV